MRHAAPLAARRTAPPAIAGVAAAPAGPGLGRALGRWLQPGEKPQTARLAAPRLRLRGSVGSCRALGQTMHCVSRSHCPGLGGRHFMACICAALAGMVWQGPCSHREGGRLCLKLSSAAGVVFRPLCLGRLCLGVRTANGTVERVACTKPVVAAGAPIHFDLRLGGAGC